MVTLPGTSCWLQARQERSWNLTVGPGVPTLILAMPWMACDLRQVERTPWGPWFTLMSEGEVGTG